MIGSDSYNSKYSALEYPKIGLKRHETFYTHYKILFQAHKHLAFFSIAEKSLGNHWKTFDEIFCMQQIFILV